MVVETHPVRHPTRGMTLFEVAISLLILSVAIVSTLMLFPMGLQSQQMARFQMIAAAKAVSVAVVPHHRLQLSVMRAEGEVSGNAADGVPVNAGPWRPDLHQRINTSRSGFGIPLPYDVARRLDSDGGEIARILDEGGTIFYAPPATSGGELFSSGGGSNASFTGHETQRILFAFVGYPQQNILSNHPNTAWPYYDWLPSPGIRGWQSRVYDQFGLTQPTRDDANPEDYHTDTSAVIDHANLPDLVTPLTGAPDPAAYHATHGDTVVMAALALKDHAYASLLWAGDDATREAQARIDADWAYAFVMYCQTWLPDDWRCPRPFVRSLMSDNTLLEYDLFGPPVTSSLYPVRRSSSPAWKSWPVMGERPVTAVAGWRGATPVVTEAGYDFGATRPFAPAERCRQLVVWVADWMTYEDFEQVPSDPIDSSRLMYHPHRSDQSIMIDPHGASKVYGSDLLHNWWSGWMGPAEWDLAWWDATRAETVPDYYRRTLPDFWTIRTGSTTETLTNAAFFGRHGADRNGNGGFDRGTVPRSVRMRALTVARFNLYDPVGFLQLR